MVVKQRDMVSLSFLALTHGVPASVRLKDHSMAYVGEDPKTSSGLITGIYGAHSKQIALVTSAKWARSHVGAEGSKPNRVLMVDTNYLIDEYQLTREQIRRDTLDKTGWLHFDRLSAGFRDEIKEMWLKWLHQDFGASHMAKLVNSTLSDIALTHPEYVTKMMKKDASIIAAVHPVHPVIDPSVVLWAATVRYDKARFGAPVVRYMSNIEVVV